MSPATLADTPTASDTTLTNWTGFGDTERRWPARPGSAAFNLVPSDADIPVGILSATSPDMECRVELISSWVAPTARRHEVGDETVHQILAWAAREHPDSRVALSVKSDNEHAIGLYARHGFVDGGVSPDDPGGRLMCR